MFKVDFQNVLIEVKILEKVYLIVKQDHFDKENVEKNV